MSIKAFQAILVSLFFAQSAFAQDPVFAVEWDAVNDPRVGLYVVGVGELEGDYTTLIDTTETTLAIPDMGIDTYHVSVQACKADKSLCSDWAVPLTYDNPIDAPTNMREALLELQSAIQGVADAVGVIAQATP